MMGTKKLSFWLAVLMVLTLSYWLFLKNAIGYETLNDTSMGRIWMENEFLDGDLMKISVKASDLLSPVLGMAFHLNYDKDKIVFLRYEPGEFLEKGGDPFYMVKNLPDQNKIVFGETLRHEDSFPLGDGIIVNLYFQILNDSEWKFVFDRGVVSGPDASRQDIDKISWEDLDVAKNDNGIVSKNGFGEKNSVLGYVSRGKTESILSGQYVSIAVVLFVVAALTMRVIVSRRGANNRHK